MTSGFDRIARMKEMQEKRRAEEEARDIVETKNEKPAKKSREKSCEMCGDTFSTRTNAQMFCVPCGKDNERANKRQQQPRRGVEKKIIPAHMRKWLALYLCLDVWGKEDDAVWTANRACVLWRCHRNLARERLHRMLSHRMVREVKKNHFVLRPRSEWLVTEA